ncbi:MAG: Arsenical pump-driving ATPase [Verrucomicrobiota bacterium]
MEEQLSGSCTVEIAAFDEFTALIGDPMAAQNYDHVVFDTAPTGHTLRLMSLAKAWDPFLDSSTSGSSCLGPLAGLDKQRAIYESTVQTLADATATTLVLVSRPQAAALHEAERTSCELRALGVGNQRLIINGVFETKCPQDLTALALAHRGVVAIKAAAIALMLAQRGHAVHLSTTDPAAHLAQNLAGQVAGLTLGKIDPAAETAAYQAEVMAAQGAAMDEASRALLAEDLRSPCAEEIAVFRAFAREVGQGTKRFVVLDTAPTGHTLLLLDASEAYQRELEGQARSSQPEEVLRLLERLRDPAYTRMVLVTLPEATPVHEAAELQDDLRRAQIEPFAWIINQSLLHSGSCDPFIWLMILPMMLKIDFGALRGVLKKPKGLCVTLVVNWLVKPFSMALLGWFFIQWLFSDLLGWIEPDPARTYTAGRIILAAAPCTAMGLTRAPKWRSTTSSWSSPSPRSSRFLSA